MVLFVCLLFRKTYRENWVCNQETCGYNFINQTLIKAKIYLNTNFLNRTFLDSVILLKSIIVLLMKIEVNFVLSSELLSWMTIYVLGQSEKCPSLSNHCLLNLWILQNSIYENKLNISTDSNPSEYHQFQKLSSD